MNLSNCPHGQTLSAYNIFKTHMKFICEIEVGVLLYVVNMYPVIKIKIKMVKVKVNHPHYRPCRPRGV
jgi:hypothetical protein